MSDPGLITQRQIQALQDDMERLRKADVTPIYLPWAQRALNPFPLASSGGVWGELGVPWSSYVLAFYVTAFVNTPNTGAAFWTLTLTASPSTNVVASVDTSAISAGAFTRLVDTTITQPASGDTDLFITATATGSPGSIYIVPAVALLRTGN